MPMRTSVRERL